MSWIVISLVVVAVLCCAAVVVLFFFPRLFGCEPKSKVDDGRSVAAAGHGPDGASGAAPGEGNGHTRMLGGPVKGVKGEGSELADAPSKQEAGAAVAPPAALEKGPAAVTVRPVVPEKIRTKAVSPMVLEAVRAKVSPPADLAGNLVSIEAGLAEVIRNVEAGLLKPKRANAIISAYSALADIITVSDTERRLAKLEALAEQRPALAGSGQIASHESPR